tara:strand:+ start:1598 stop:1837 length:240 start_codon:yes stop_codon:yes gene_type:complete
VSGDDAADETALDGELDLMRIPRDTSESEEQSKSISPYGDIAQPELWLTRGDRAARPSRAKVPLNRGVGADESPTGGTG